MAATTMVHVRVGEAVKEKASAALAQMGISVSDAVRMMLVRVADEKALPFEVRVPNATTPGPEDSSLPSRYRDYALSGEWKPHRDITSSPTAASLQNRG